MKRWFNVAGPCRADVHYMLSALDRLPNLITLITEQNYFILHAPRQTGKTTAMLAVAHELTTQGTYTAALLSVEVGAPFSDDPSAAEDAILGSWRSDLCVRLPADLQPPPWPTALAGTRIRDALQAWSQASSRPLVLFLDEIDALRDAALISVLRQLRTGYTNRPAAFPWSVGLIGLRDVRDYKVAAGGSERLNTASPFNIKTESLTLRNFSATEVAALYTQHTADTGQIFTPEACVRAFYLTQGQPWLVNALARQATRVVAPDLMTPITPAIIDQAKELLIQRQDTHLDSLAERLREERVRRVIEPIISGQVLGHVPDDDIRFVLDLGLCRMASGGGLEIANPIYNEVVPRVLSNITFASLPSINPTWLTADGQLDTVQLLEAFLAFWRHHGELLLGSAPYHEIAPHLVMMAFLHRVINGGGTIEREYAIGRDRMDLCLRYGDVTLGIEIKTWRNKRPDPLQAGLTQLDTYLARLSLSSGWLVIFDQRSDLPAIAERTTTQHVQTPAGRTVVVMYG